MCITVLHWSVTFNAYDGVNLYSHKKKDAIIKVSWILFSSVMFLSGWKR